MYPVPAIPRNHACCITSYVLLLSAIPQIISHKVYADVPTASRNINCLWVLHAGTGGISSVRLKRKHRRFFEIQHQSAIDCRRICCRGSLGLVKSKYRPCNARKLIAYDHLHVITSRCSSGILIIQAILSRSINYDRDNSTWF